MTTTHNGLSLEYFTNKYGEVGSQCWEYWIKDYSIVTSYDGDLVAYFPTDGWADYNMWDTYTLETGCGGVVLEYAK